MTITAVAPADPAGKDWRNLPIWALDVLDYLAAIGQCLETSWRKSFISAEPVEWGFEIRTAAEGLFTVYRFQGNALYRMRALKAGSGAPQ